ncbi:MAG: succinate dehydrogenase, hydrophobic membrane anchor protein [Steroidobacteraceae bacterium]
MSLRSPLGTVLGLGSARDGVGHWWMLRASSVALVPLMLWFVLALVSLGTIEHAAIITFLRQPLNSLLTILLVLVAAHHSHLGLSVIIEDYVHAPMAKIGSLLASRFVHVVGAAAGIYAVLRIAFGNPIP